MAIEARAIEPERVTAEVRTTDASAAAPSGYIYVKTGVDVSGVTATADKVLEGYRIVDASGEEVEGAMPNRGSAWLYVNNDTPSESTSPSGVSYYTRVVTIARSGYYSTISAGFNSKSLHVTPTTSEQYFGPDNSKRIYENVTVDPIPPCYGLITWDGSVLTIS